MAKQEKSFLWPQGPLCNFGNFKGQKDVLEILGLKRQFCKVEGLKWNLGKFGVEVWFLRKVECQSLILGKSIWWWAESGICVGVSLI